MPTDRVAIAAFVISIVATVFAGLAAAFTGLQWREARQQRQQQFDSTLVFDIDTELSQRRAGIAIRNVGPGIARLSSVTYYMDGKVRGMRALRSSRRISIRAGTRALISNEAIPWPRARSIGSCAIRSGAAMRRSARAISSRSI
jgi:hypothetical protein